MPAEVRRGLIDQLTRLLGWLRRSHRASLDDVGRPVKVNLGSSLLVADGWVNIDCNLSALVAGWPRPALRGAYRLARISAELSEAEYIDLLERHRFIHYNLEYGIPLPDATVDYLFASHFLEHLSQRHGELLTHEAARVLRPGGVIRIAVPDLTACMVRDQTGDRGPALDAISDDRGLGHFARHRYMYDFPMLVDLLNRAGLGDVRRCEFREGRVPDIEVLDNRPGSLVVEAAKPT